MEIEHTASKRVVSLGDLSRLQVFKPINSADVCYFIKISDEINHCKCIDIESKVIDSLSKDLEVIPIDSKLIIYD